MGPWVIDQSHSISVALLEEARVPSSMGNAPTEGKLMSIVTKNALRVLVTALSFLTIAAIPSVVLAQQGIAKACAADVKAQCAGHRGEGRIACVKTRFKDFSLRCQLALVKGAAIRKACKADAEKTCADIERGSGRIEACLKDHFADLSDGCKETITQAADKS